MRISVANTICKFVN